MTEPTLGEFASVDALKRELRKANRTVSKLRQERVDLEGAVVRAAETAFGAMDLPVPVRPKGRISKGTEVAVVMDADWQLAKITPDYDSEIAAARLRDYFARTIRLTEIQRAEHPVDEAELWVLGDIVEGERIFPGQEFLIDSALIDQIFGVGLPLLRDQIYAYLETFKRLTVRMVVGNHGRIGRRGEYHPNTNADRMLYFAVKQWFDAAGVGGDRLVWDIPTYEKGDRGWYTIAQIGRYSSLLIHGDQFRGGGGISGLPYPSMMKKALYWRDAALDGLLEDVDPYDEDSQVAYRSAGKDMPVFQDIACGHWHVAATIPVGRRFLRIAGSPESYNVWSQEFLSRTQRPSQRMMFVHPGRGIVTSEYAPLWLD
jgi:hypothetical protein